MIPVDFYLTIVPAIFAYLLEIKSGRDQPGMKRYSETVENYLKTILRFTRVDQPVSTNTIAQHLGTSAASVTDMLKKLCDEKLVDYTPYKGASLTREGETVALQIIRKHRLWEVFLVEKLNFSWDHVHEVAEQLEHVESDELIERIDEFLGFPKFDPHGDPIPSIDGTIEILDTQLLSELPEGTVAQLVRVRSSETGFLQYLDRLGIALGSQVRLIERLTFDDSLVLEVDRRQVVMSGPVADNLLMLLPKPASGTPS